MKAIIAVSLCLCLLLAPTANAQGLVDTVIKGCTTGMTSTLCKGAVSRATSLCKAPGGGGNCISMLTDLCRKNKKICENVSGPLCKATGTYATQCTTAVKTALSPIGGIAGSLLG
jgi:hypothetical protein